MTTYTIRSVKHTEDHDGTWESAVERARVIEEEYQPAFGVAVEDTDGALVAEVRDGMVDDRREEA